MFSPNFLPYFFSVLPFQHPAFCLVSSSVASASLSIRFLVYSELLPRLSGGREGEKPYTMGWSPPWLISQGRSPSLFKMCFLLRTLWTAPVLSLNAKLVLNQVLKCKSACQSNAGWCRNFPKWQPTPHILYRLKNKELKLSNNSKNIWRLLLWAWISLICTASWCSKKSELHKPSCKKRHSSAESA